MGLLRQADASLPTLRRFRGSGASAGLRTDQLVLPPLWMCHMPGLSVTRAPMSPSAFRALFGDLPDGGILTRRPQWVRPRES